MVDSECQEWDRVLARQHLPLQRDLIHAKEAVLAVLVAHPVVSLVLPHRQEAADGRDRFES